MMDGITYIFGFIEGVLTFISPCILPLLPVYFFYLAGVSDEGASAGMQDRSRLIGNSIGFVLGFTLVFVALGAAATSLGQFLKSNMGLFRKLSGILMILFGLNFTGIFKLNFLNVERRFEYKFKKLNFLNSIVFGAVFGFGWTPCLGAFLGSALLLAGNSETLWQGVSLLLVYSIGLGIPFIVTSVIFDRVKSSFRNIQKYSRIISIISGIVLILAGILVFTDRLSFLAALTW